MSFSRSRQYRNANIVNFVLRVPLEKSTRQMEFVIGKCNTLKLTDITNIILCKCKEGNCKYVVMLILPILCVCEKLE